MAKKNAESGVYRVTEVIGTSKVSWEDAAKNAVETAAKSLRVQSQVGEDLLDHRPFQDGRDDLDLPAQQFEQCCMCL